MITDIIVTHYFEHIKWRMITNAKEKAGKRTIPPLLSCVYRCALFFTINFYLCASLFVV